jgi:5' nucleotidase, deoxy (Pyrimidine), cytosolic type C protein (NT5C)
MTLRIGFDMDGVLADFAAAYHDVEARLFGPAPPTRPDDPETEPSEPPATNGRRRDAVWQAIRETPDFWTTLTPTDAQAVRRIHEMMLRHPWEVFFITQRPATAGETVQRQTQHWLVAQGFDLPSVLVIAGSRGAAAGALRLDYHVDDSPTNCVDVKSESGAKPILIVPDGDATTMASARNLGIGTSRTIADALDILEEATTARSQPKLLGRIAALVGWR